MRKTYILFYCHSNFKMHYITAPSGLMINFSEIPHAAGILLRPSPSSKRRATLFVRKHH